jgi:hypothetical protein
MPHNKQTSPCFRSGFGLALKEKASGDMNKDVGNLATNILTNPSWGVITALAFGLAITGELSAACAVLFVEKGTMCSEVSELSLFVCSAACLPAPGRHLLAAAEAPNLPSSAA